MIETTIITELAVRGITLHAEGDRIRAHGQLDDNARALIRTHKTRLLKALAYRRDLTTPEADTAPYRLHLDGYAQVIWLPAGLSPAEAIDQARAKSGPDRIADPGVAPVGGWPSLREIPEIGSAGLVEAAEERAAILEHDTGLGQEDADQTARQAYGLVRCGDCQHFQPDQIGDGSGIGRCGVGRTPRYPETPCYPRVLRWCADWVAKP